MEFDRYKDAADRGAFQIEVTSEGYSPDLETLVNGVLGASGHRVDWNPAQEPHLLAHDIHRDYAMQDDPDSDSWNADGIVAHSQCQRPWGTPPVPQSRVRARGGLSNLGAEVREGQ